jgi:hypothetical protein
LLAPSDSARFSTLRRARVRRFVFLWAILGVVQWAAGTAVDAAGFRRLDWTYEAFCAALLVPAAQAALRLIVPAARGIAFGSVSPDRVASFPSRLSSPPTER